MWIETDHHGLVNLNHVKRIDLGGDLDKKTLGIYLFDVDGNTYPIIDIPRFTHIGVLQGNEKEQDIQMAVFCFYSVTKKLLATMDETEVITIEAIYKDFASEWHAQRQKEPLKNMQESGAQKRKKSKASEKSKAASINNVTGTIHHLSDANHFLDMYTQIFSMHFKRSPILDNNNDRKIAMELTKRYTIIKLETLLHGYFESKEDFIVSAHYDIRTFKAILESTDMDDII